MKLALYIVVCIISRLIQRCNGFLLTDNCLAPPPCTCSGIGSSAVTVDCSYKNLNTTPTFLNVDVKTNTLYIVLKSNKITVPDDAFQELSNTNASHIDIDLDNNDMSSLSHNVFTDIEHIVKQLTLRNNKLPGIPLAISKLKALRHLDVRGNPLRSLEYSVMSNISQSLQTFLLDLKLFITWPNEIGLLHVLQVLSIETVPFANLKTDVFQSFESSLIVLEIMNVPLLQKIPQAICRLPKLQSLFLQNFTSINQKGTIFELCEGPHTSLKSLTLENFKLYSFPDVLQMFPSLMSINFASNNFEIIETEKLRSDAPWQSINLARNHFKRIPEAINKMKSLNILFMDSNNILALDDSDLTGLVNLTSLFLSHNPIRYISNDAFRNNPHLSILDLSSTNLLSVPLAVTVLPNLMNLNLQATLIPCTCEMSYLKGWNASVVESFYGSCAYSFQKIQDYIMTSLQQCP